LLASAFLLLLNFNVTRFSGGRWTVASISMAGLTLWNVLGFMGGFTMNTSFDFAKAQRDANEPAGLPDSQEEWRQQSAARLVRTWLFMTSFDYTIVMLIGIMTNEACQAI